MSQATRRNASDPVLQSLSRGAREGLLFVLSAIAIYLLIALTSYHPEDPGWSHSGFRDHVQNNGGRAGAWFADLFFYLFGYLAFLFPILVGYIGWLIFKDRASLSGFGAVHLTLRLAGFVLTLVAGSALAGLHLDSLQSSLPVGAGGALGQLVAKALVIPFNRAGATLLLLALFLAGVTLFTGLSWLRVVDLAGRLALKAAEWAAHELYRLRDRIEAKRVVSEREEGVKPRTKPPRSPIRIEPVITKVEPSARAQQERQGKLFRDDNKGSLPSLSLLDKPKKQVKPVSHESLEAISRLVELKLADFGIEVQVVGAHPGPVVTRFEMQPAPGVKVSQIVSLAKDLARALSVVSVRVVEVIPGKPYVGLEIPNEQREMVALIEVLESRSFAEMNSPLTLALGKDISGNPIAVDLARMPHLLVAGTTGSGKSVALNSMVLSLVYSGTPEQVRLIMIDPKMLELSVYDGIPHLLAPVVTDMKEAASALRWCVIEMDRRYRLLAALGVRNIGGYNRKVQEAAAEGKPLLDPIRADPTQPPAELETLPYVVVIIDELADMMMLVGKKVEELIARLAQKARAAGIHLIVATQRPSVDVITGLIKANIPCRIAFQVSSRIDSRTILDQQGAEQLLGQGDMLYLPPGSGVPQRIHGAFVDDHEVHNVVRELKKIGKPNYIEAILASTDAAPGEVSYDEITGEPNGTDELYDMAVRVVTETRRASVSGVQRRLKIGYNRAARLVEEMERQGVVGSLQSNGAREILAPPPPGGSN